MCNSDFNDCARNNSDDDDCKDSNNQDDDSKRIHFKDLKIYDNFSFLSSRRRH